MSESVDEVSGFTAMGLDPRLMNALGYKVPSPIQREAIPVLLEGKDLIGLADSQLYLAKHTGRGRVCSAVLTPGTTVGRG